MDEAIVPDVQTDEYETDDYSGEDNNVQDELPVNGKCSTVSGRVIRAVVRLISA